jgi:hypothetical protein
MIKPRRKKVAEPKPEPEEVPEPEKPATRMFIEPFNALSFAVRGDTRPHADELRRFFGKFNPQLKGGPGWIFSIKRLEEVTKFIDVKNDGGDVTELLPPIRPDVRRPNYQALPQPRQNPPPMSNHPPPMSTYNRHRPNYPTLYEKGLQKAAMESNLYTAMLIWFQADGDMEGFHNYITEMSARVFEGVRADL